MKFLKEYIQQTFADEFYKNIAKLFTGTTIARFFPFVFAFGLARIYSPVNFGDFVLWLTVGSVLSIISTGKYESAVVIAENDDLSQNVFTFGIKLILAVNVLLGGIFLLVAMLFELPSFSVLTVGLIVLFSGSFAILQMVRAKLTRKKAYSLIAKIEVLRAVAMGVGQFAFFFNLNSGLFIGVVIGQFVPLLFYSKSLGLPSLKELAEQRLFNNAVAIRFIKFPKFTLPSEILNFISSQLPILIFKPMFGDTQMGVYSFAHRYISIPVQLIAKSISGVLVEKATSIKNNKEELRKTTQGLFYRQFITGIIPFSILAFWGDWLFVVFFGEEWRQAGVMAQIISPWLFAVMLGSPLSSLIDVFERQKFSMQFNALFIVARVAAILLGYFFFHSMEIAVAFYSGVGFLFFIYLALYNLRLANVPLGKMLFFMVKIVVVVELPLIAIKLFLC